MANGCCDHFPVAVKAKLLLLTKIRRCDTVNLVTFTSLCSDVTVVNAVVAAA